MPRYYKAKIYDESEKERIAYYWKKKSDLLNAKLVELHGERLQSYKSEIYLNGQRKLAEIKTEKL